MAVTRVKQTFRNPTSRQLEATYVFPVPKGASVKKFTMWVDGKEVTGELVEADKARTIYTDIVRRTQDPGLLEYMGNNLLRLRVFPVPANGDQKVSVSFTSVAAQDDGLVEYVYPLKADGKAVATLEKFSLERHAEVAASAAERLQPEPLDQGRAQGRPRSDRHLRGSQAVARQGLPALLHAGQQGRRADRADLPAGRRTGRLLHAADLAAGRAVARSSTCRATWSSCSTPPAACRGRRWSRPARPSSIASATCAARSLRRHELRHHGQQVSPTRWQPASSEQLEQAKKWVDDLEATGGTAIDDALDAALDMRTGDDTAGPSPSSSSPTASRPSAKPIPRRS